VAEDVVDGLTIHLVITVTDHIADAANAAPVDFGRINSAKIGFRVIDANGGLADYQKLPFNLSEAAVQSRCVSACLR
jgi:hypothetical protein